MSKLIFSKFTLIILGILVIYVGFSALKQYRKRASGVDELNGLKQEIAQLEKNNSELMEFIKYLESPNFTEQEARKMNLKKPGEKVAVISRVAGDRIVVEHSQVNANKTNPGKWFDYFFTQP